jgi:hypothetical protein
VIGVHEIQDPQCEPSRVVGVDGKRADDEHPKWCSPEHCYMTTDGVRVHEQALTRWEGETGEVRFESRLLDPSDDEHLYLDLDLRCLKLTGNGFRWVVILDTARRLRDQLTAHLDVAEGADHER